jgi:hypothetical protein
MEDIDGNDEAFPLARRGALSLANSVCGGCCGSNSWRCYGPDGIAELKGYPTAMPVPKGALEGTVAKRLWVEPERLTRVKFGALSDAA